MLTQIANSVFRAFFETWRQRYGPGTCHPFVALGGGVGQLCLMMMILGLARLWSAPSDHASDNSSNVSLIVASWWHCSGRSWSGISG
jgi:hypothetical protein